MSDIFNHNYESFDFDNEQCSDKEANYHYERLKKLNNKKKELNNEKTNRTRPPEGHGRMC